VAGTGFEQSGKRTIHSENPNQGDAESGALAAGDVQIDPDLEFITRAWPNLSDTVRNQLVHLIKESRQDSEQFSEIIQR